MNSDLLLTLSRLFSRSPRWEACFWSIGMQNMAAKFGLPTLFKEAAYEIFMDDFKLSSTDVDLIRRHCRALAKTGVIDHTLTWNLEVPG